jgi:hypothetical protein
MLSARGIAVLMLRLQLTFAVAMSTGTDSDMQAARAALKTAEELAEKLVEENKPAGVLASVWNSFSMWDSSPKIDETKKLWTYFSALVALGEIGLNQLTLFFKERQWLSIGLTARRSWKMCEEAEEALRKLKESAQADGYILPSSDRDEEVDVLSRLEFVVGLYHFVVSLVPPNMLMFVEAIGFEADRNTGIKELQSALERKGIHFVTAGILLISYHNFFMQTVFHFPTLCSPIMTFFLILIFPGWSCE